MPNNDRVREGSQPPQDEQHPPDRHLGNFSASVFLKERRPSVRPDAIVDQIQAAALKDFLQDYTHILHSLANYLTGPGIGGENDYNSCQRQNPELNANYLSLRKEVIALFDAVDAAVPQWKAAMREGSVAGAARVYRLELLPLLDGLLNAEGLLARLAAHFEQVHEKWQKQMAKSGRDYYNEAYIAENYEFLTQHSRSLFESFKGLRYDETLNTETVSLGQVVIAYAGRCEVGEISSGACINAVPGEVEYIVKQLSTDLSMFIQAVRSQVQEEVIGKKSLRSLLDTQVLTEEVQELLSEGVFCRTRPTVEISTNGTLEFSFAPEPAFFEALSAALPLHREPLANCASVVKMLGGKLDISLETGKLVVSVDLPAASESGPAYLEILRGQLERQRNDRFSHSPGMMQISCSVEVPFFDGTSGELHLTFDGGMLMTPEGRQWGNRAIERAAFFMQARPELNHLAFRALGSERSIINAYVEESAIGISISTYQENREDEDSRPSYHYIRHAVYGDGSDPATESHSFFKRTVGFASISLDPNTFFSPIMGPLIADVLRAGTPQQFSISHDQEDEIEGDDEALQRHALLCRDLTRVLRELGADTGAADLRFVLMTVSAFRVAQIGTFDEIYALEVYDGDALCAVGHFSKSQTRFHYKRIDTSLEQEIAAKVLPLLSELHIGGVLKRELLDRMLQREGIKIADVVLDNLMASVRGEGGDEYFSGPTPDRILQHELRRLEVTVERGDQITVSLKTKEPHAEPKVIYGYILNLDGTRGDPVTNIRTASFLARSESRSPFFEATQDFWDADV